MDLHRNIREGEGALLGIAGVGAVAIALSLGLDRQEPTLLGVGTGLVSGAAIMYLYGRYRA